MVSFPEADYEFFMDIKQSAKNKIKLTLHIQSDDLNIPLLRIDYGGTHKNPEESDWFVPSEFERFTGKAFDVSTPHIHYYVEGYGLKWAIPLSIDDFPVKRIQGIDDIKAAILAMAVVINLQTIINITIQDEVM